MRAARVRPMPIDAAARPLPAFARVDRPALQLVPAPTARYGSDTRPNWALIGGLAAGHLALFALLATTGVVELAPAPKPPVVITLLPEAAPPPPPVAQPEPAAATLAEPVLAAPLPVVKSEPVATVAVAVPAPQPIPAPAPAVTVAVAAPAPAVAPSPAAVPAPPAPITSPDFSARQLNNPGPRYPVESSRLKEAGTVKLRVVVTAQGRAGEIAVAVSSGSSRLDRAALDCVKRWRFVPAQQAGAAVAATVIVPVTFRRPD